MMNDNYLILELCYVLSRQLTLDATMYGREMRRGRGEGDQSQ